MSFKCSLLGHRFDETTVERDRQEDGSEVVTTITELETCSRCGETRVVSENKEVTTMETPDIDAETDAGVGGKSERETGTGAGPGTGTSAGAELDETGAGGADREDDAEILDDEGSEADAQTEARSASIPDAETGSGPDSGAVESGNGTAESPEDDAVIIDGDDGTASDDSPRGGAGDDSPQGVAGGAVGDEESGTRSEDETVGEAPGDASGTDKWPDEAGDDDQTSTSVDVTGESGEWPEEPEPETDREVLDEWPEETRRETSEETGVTIEESASPTVTVPEGMFKCSECGFTTEVESSSLRAGDFCPECHRGTLVQHEDDDA